MTLTEKDRSDSLMPSPLTVIDSRLAGSVSAAPTQPGVALTDKVAHFIARHVVKNVRELEGALIKVTAPPDKRSEPVVLDGTTLDGGAFASADNRGKLLVINVWASWCVS